MPLDGYICRYIHKRSGAAGTYKIRVNYFIKAKHLPKFPIYDSQEKATRYKATECINMKCRSYALYQKKCALIFRK